MYAITCLFKSSNLSMCRWMYPHLYLCLFICHSCIEDSLASPHLPAGIGPSRTVILHGSTRVVLGDRVKRPRRIDRQLLYVCRHRNSVRIPDGIYNAPLLCISPLQQECGHDKKGASTTKKKQSVLCLIASFVLQPLVDRYMAYIARKYKVTVLQAATGQWDWGAALTKLSQHYGTQLDDLFNTIDTDNSGHIDATELFAALIEAGQPITMKMIQALVC